MRIRAGSLFDCYLFSGFQLVGKSYHTERAVPQDLHKLVSLHASLMDRSPGSTVPSPLLVYSCYSNTRSHTLATPIN